MVCIIFNIIKTSLKITRLEAIQKTNNNKISEVWQLHLYINHFIHETYFLIAEQLNNLLFNRLSILENKEYDRKEIIKI